MKQHLQGLAAKMAARDKRHAKKGNKSVTGKGFAVPARPVRFTRADRQEPHKSLMEWKREQRLRLGPGFYANPVR